MKVIESSNLEMPVVRITEAAMRSVASDIIVDLDGLNDLLRDDLGLISEERPNFVLYGITHRSPLNGFHFPFTKTAYVQVPSSAQANSLNDYSIRNGLTRTLVHESSHLVDSMDRKRRTLGETATRVAWNVGAVQAGHETAQYIGGIGGIATGIGLAVAGKQLFYSSPLDRGEDRARGFHHNDELVRKYRNVVRLVNNPLA